MVLFLVMRREIPSSLLHADYANSVENNSTTNSVEELRNFYDAKREFNYHPGFLRKIKEIKRERKRQEQVRDPEDLIEVAEGEDKEYDKLLERIDELLQDSEVQEKMATLERYILALDNKPIRIDTRRHITLNNVSFYICFELFENLTEDADGNRYVVVHVETQGEDKIIVIENRESGVYQTCSLAEASTNLLRDGGNVLKKKYFRIGPHDHRETLLLLNINKHDREIRPKYIGRIMLDGRWIYLSKDVYSNLGDASIQVTLEEGNTLVRFTNPNTGLYAEISVSTLAQHQKESEGGVAFKFEQRHLGPENRKEILLEIWLNENNEVNITQTLNIYIDGRLIRITDHVSQDLKGNMMRIELWDDIEPKIICIRNPDTNMVQTIELSYLASFVKVSDGGGRMAMRNNPYITGFHDVTASDFEYDSHGVGYEIQDDDEEEVIDDGELEVDESEERREKNNRATNDIYTRKMHAHIIIGELTKHISTHTEEELQGLFDNHVTRDQALQLFRTSLEGTKNIKEKKDLARLLACDADIQRAKNELYNENFRLVNFVINLIYPGTFLQDNPEFLKDIKQEGSIGLLVTAEKFNPRRGYQFSTYAVWWIKQAILRRAGSFEKTIIIPEYVSQQLTHVLRAFEKYRLHSTSTDEIEPSQLEARSLDTVSIDEPTDHHTVGIHKLIQDDESISENLRSELTLKRVGDLLNVQQVVRVRRLDQPFVHDGTMSLADTIPADTVESPESLDTEDIISLIKTILTPRELDVVVLNTGLKDGEEHSFQAIATTYNLSRERVRQIYVKALKKIRDYANENQEFASELGMWIK